jgi:hypothetical protein
MCAIANPLGYFRRVARRIGSKSEHLALPRVFAHTVELLEVGNRLKTKPMLKPLLM